MKAQRTSFLRGKCTPQVYKRDELGNVNQKFGDTLAARSDVAAGPKAFVSIIPNQQNEVIDVTPRIVTRANPQRRSLVFANLGASRNIGINFDSPPNFDATGTLIVGYLLKPNTNTDALFQFPNCPRGDVWMAADTGPVRFSVIEGLGVRDE